MDPDNILVQDIAGRLELEGMSDPRPDDILHTYSDYSGEHKDIGGRMMIHRKNEAGETEIFNRGYYSSVLDKHRKNGLFFEGEAIKIKPDKRV